MFDNHIFRCLVISPAGKSICDFDLIKQLLEALRDAIKAHQSLYTVGKILHRDISENNIIITDPEKTGGFAGMLIDLDQDDGRIRYRSSRDRIQHIPSR